MLNLSAIAGLSATVGDDWTSPVADAVSAAWDIAPGTALWVRSSATHVFAAGGLFLRFVPEGHGDLAGTASLTLALAEAGHAVAAPVPAASGDLTAAVATPLGAMTAMAVRRAPGARLEAEELDAGTAAAWGAALARLHTFPVPRPAFGLPGAVLAHGDFELDNIAWSDGAFTAFDFDEAGLASAAADIAHATRDLTAGTGTPTAEHAARFASFVDGYRSVRDLPEAELARVPEHARAHAARAAAELPAKLDAGGRPGDPEWLTRLRDRLAEYVEERRAIAG